MIVSSSVFSDALRVLRPLPLVTNSTRCLRAWKLLVLRTFHAALRNLALRCGSSPSTAATSDKVMLLSLKLMMAERKMFDS